MTPLTKSPAELRSMFGSNLRQLAQGFPSISELSRQLGINRTQFNRYLAGESFPRPDVLARICVFFDVDARVLLEPVDVLESTSSILSGAELGEFVGAGSTPTEDLFPGGFYRFSRKSFFSPDKYTVGLVRVWRNDTSNCFLRGFEAREAMRMQGLPMRAEMREFRGLVLATEDGVSFIVSRRGARTSSFNFLQRIPSFENNFWIGYVARTVPENVETERAVRMVYEHIGNDFKNVLQAARTTGLIEETALPEFQKRLLQSKSGFR